MRVHSASRPAKATSITPQSLSAEAVTPPAAPDSARARQLRFRFYTDVSGKSSISSKALRVVLLLFLEESWILLKSAFLKIYILEIDHSA